MEVGDDLGWHSGKKPPVQDRKPIFTEGSLFWPNTGLDIRSIWLLTSIVIWMDQHRVCMMSISTEWFILNEVIMIFWKQAFASENRLTHWERRPLVALEIMVNCLNLPGFELHRCKTHAQTGAYDDWTWRCLPNLCSVHFPARPMLL